MDAIKLFGALRIAVVVAAGIIAAIPVNADTLTGRVSLSLRPGNKSLFIEGESAGLADVIFILTNNSNANAVITTIAAPVLEHLDQDVDDLVVGNSITLMDTNPCKGRTLLPGDVCAFSATFDTTDNSNNNDGDSSLWKIRESAFITYQTRPFNARFETNTVRAPVTVVDPPTNVPEPSSLLLLGFGLVFMICTGRRVRHARIRQPTSGSEAPRNPRSLTET